MSIPLIDYKTIQEMEDAIKEKFKRSKMRTSLLDLMKMLKEHHLPANSPHYRVHIIAMTDERMRRLTELEKLHKVRI